MISLFIGIVLAVFFIGIGIFLFSRAIEEKDYSGNVTQTDKSKLPALSFFAMAVLSFSLGAMLYPVTSVWQKTLSGKAQLKEAQWNRQILIQEAEAKKESAKHWAQAEIERAKGAAKSNEIVANSLGGPEGYLRWLYIQMLEETNNNVIYIPTEAGLPILEAGKR